MENKKNSRRSFISKSALAAFTAVIGTKVVFGENFPQELAPIGLDEQVETEKIPGKSNDLTILNRKPWNAETPPHLLDPEITPANLMFVRNNGIPPEIVDLDTWTLTIDGESANEKRTFTLKELYENFNHYTYDLTLECGGNGRSEFNPPAKGNQWGLGAVACTRWTGVRLKDVLNAVGLKKSAVYIGYYGADTHLSGDPEKVVISRGVPIGKAMEDESLIAWAMNGEAIPKMNGYPLRLVMGGWPASVSGKWLTRISIRNKVHDGAKMEGHSYRVPKFPVPPGTKVPDEHMKIIESMPIKSIITFPKTGALIAKGKPFEVRGHAWAGDLSVSAVQVSIDFGVTWKKCIVNPPKNRLAWQRWTIELTLPEFGYYEIWARAIDSNGKGQPMILPGWNPKGYLNNACHRIAVKQA
ncbi:MAG: DMSO/TMAO reductase YedYZ molybdopterin-dependent catalytic subunit [Crocinitomix sp.]|jgi:DMSO/TMAO reductase YedYZ molybdopterin-dependent catalytic subunit